MFGLARILSRAGLVLVITLTVAFSASCGCGGGSAGPPGPSSGGNGYSGGYSGGYIDYTGAHRDYYYPRNYKYNHDKYSRQKSTRYKDKHRDTRRVITVNRRTTGLLRERWLAGAGYLMDAEYHNVAKATGLGMSDWLSLIYLPVCPADSPPDAAGVASALYSLTTDSLGDGETYLELTWEDAPVDNTCWIAVHRPGVDGGSWNWFRPGTDMRIALHPLGQYRSPDAEQRVYVAVVLTGRRACALRKIALREYYVQGGAGGDPQFAEWGPRHGEPYHAATDPYALTLQPACSLDSRPGDPGVAGASITLEAPSPEGSEYFLDLDWGVAPVGVEYCRVAVCRPGQPEETWNWFRPGPDMRIGLSPITQYQDPWDEGRINVMVEVLGDRYCTLQGVELREYRYDW